MPLGTSIAAEIKHEAANTRKILSRLPVEYFGWKPHEKSMTAGKLASHIADLTQWAVLIVQHAEFDFLKTPLKRCNAADTKELLEAFEQNLSDAITALQALTDDTLEERWRLCRGEVVIADIPRKVALRSML